MDWSKVAVTVVDDSIPETPSAGVCPVTVGSDGTTTVTLKAGSDAERVPLCAVMMMSVATPEPLGVPFSAPVCASKVAQDGILLMVKPAASVAVGMNEYGFPTAVTVGGAPDMVGWTRLNVAR